MKRVFLSKAIVSFFFFLILCFSLLILKTPVLSQTGTTYYVSTTGNDSNAGTQSQPWKTIQKAANTALAGNTIIVLAGNYSTERVQVTRSGTAGSSITYQANGTVTMRGFTVIASYITIDGFDITNTANADQDGWGVYVKGSHCLIENNYIYYATRGGILLYADQGSYNNTVDNTVRNNVLYRNSQVGVQVQGNNSLIEGNEVSHSLQYHPSWVNPPDWVDADGMRFFGSGHIFRGNYIHDITMDDPENHDPHIDGFQTFDNSGWTVGTNCIFEQNLVNILDNGSEAFMTEGSSGLIIRNNIFHCFRGVIASRSTSYQIVNNTYVTQLNFDPNVGPVGVSLEESATNMVIKNNIWYNSPVGGIYVHDNGSLSGLDAGHNLTYRSDGGSTSGTHYPGDLWQINPQYVNPASDFHLQAGSPAINAGVAIGSVTNDYDGNARPQGTGYDIGAYEYGGTVQPTSVPTSTPTPKSSLTPTSKPTPTSTPTPTPTIDPCPNRKIGNLDCDAAGKVNQTDFV